MSFRREKKKIERELQIHMNMNSKGVQAENNPNIITYNTTIAVSYNIKSILCARKFRIKGKK